MNNEQGTRNVEHGREVTFFIQNSLFLVQYSCCPTRIRTSTNRTKICRTTIILSGIPDSPDQGLQMECKSTPGNAFEQMDF